ncbi:MULTISPECIES: S8 family serine peptidase [Micromonospora]|uniref:Peptidase S8 n=1 Tax=Micromonospora solifontis TaxID=2487138 RepID=A0ABX9WFH0_9ACTN|nr:MULTISPECIES: S8 family serine peptidase [Micromonospora]NES16529.1 S8 family serine peptidase [Micromonospora sp. PPF5-17B]NES37455.1 S8 family serine peptidase [Micromonospora solifontis]NES58187.1 S8 family serine peptidase [Micromonospora sp. PPF5-6]RNL98366.1 peptidase S8 [Micromonospora solifontis]
MHRSPRWLAAGAVGALLVGLAAPASADPPAPPAAPSPATAGPDPAPARVTLITGDRVELVRAAPGRVAATVHPGPGRERITFQTVQADGGLRVLPSDAVPYLAAGVLDPDLFDVQELVADGYGDVERDALPLIVRYQEPAAGRVRTLAGATAVRPLESINGAALRVGRDDLGGLWTALRGTSVARTAAGSPARFGAGVARVWLDGRVHVALERSVPQIGAPAAWAAGRDGAGVEVAVLDTGVDAGHPDLAGRIAEARDFTGGGSARDGHGHGTHVAATIAGSGAAADGLRKGVAPGARLLVGKVLDDSGAGYDSSIIAGMEWAAHSGARVVSMSLGGPPTDGTDPMSEAVDDLTAETGTLFVIAAGNEGAASSVGTPGAATAALTVGAVDRDDELAPFSSRGPRAGDNGLKPEITAPGVGIVAARAAGTTMGTPVDDLYTRASGTSMATPHVAGAAAILAQEHPDWTAGKLKDALVSTAKANPALTVFEQGGGRVDVARALTQRVYGSATADFGRVATGGVPVTRTVTYTNGTAAAQTLRLALDLRNLDSGTVEPDGVSLDATEVTVPAGGSVAVPLHADPAKLDRGVHGGWLVATGADGVAVRTAVGLTLSGPLHTVTLSALDLRGQSGTASVVTLFGEHAESDRLGFLLPGMEWQVSVEEGPYLLEGLIEHGAPLDEQLTLVTDPELTVDRDLTVVLDPRQGTPVRIETPKPTEQRDTISFYEHRVFGNGRQVDHGVMAFSTVQQVNVTPTRPVRRGEFEFASRWQLVAPMVTAQVSNVTGPLDINLLGQSPAPAGRRKLPLVWAGDGTPAELARAGVRGAAALVAGSYDRAEEDQIADATAAGAATVLIVRPADRSAWTVWRPDGDRLPIPSLVVAYDDGQPMIAAAKRGRATLDLTLTVDSPYLYDVWQVSKGRVPERILHRVTADNTAEVTARYADTGGFDWAAEQRFGWRPWQEYSWNDDQRMVRTGTVRQEFVSAGDSWWQQRVLHRLSWSDWGPLIGGLAGRPRRYAADDRVTETWHAPVVRPAVPVGGGAPLPTRTGDILDLRVAEFVDADGHYAPAGFGEEQDTVQARLSRDGQQIADLSGGWAPVPTVPGAARYRLDLTTRRSSDEWRWATRTETAWEFSSARPTGDAAQPLPLLQVDYRVPADLRGEVAGGHPHPVGLTLRQPAGVPAPTGAAVRVEVSFDGGSSWRAVPVRGSGTRFTAQVPAGHGTVSLRVHARDGAGNTVEQTVLDAYGLR